MMTPGFSSDIDDLAAADDRWVALGYVTEAFAEAILAGIEGDSFAHACTCGAKSFHVPTGPIFIIAPVA